MVSIIVSVSLITMLSGCDKKDQVSIPDSDDWKDMQVIMHGVRIKGAENMTLDDLLDLGFKKEMVSSMFVNESELDAGDTSNFMLVAEDGSVGVYDIVLMNYSDKKTSVENCDIRCIYINGLENSTESKDAKDSEDSIVCASDIYLANGVGLGMTSEEVRTIMGEPTSEMVLEEVTTTKVQKVWRYSVDKEKKQSIEIMFDPDEKVKMVVLKY